MDYNITLYAEPRYMLHTAVGERVFIIDGKENKMILRYSAKEKEECVRILIQKLDSLTIYDCIEQEKKQIEDRKVYDRKYKWYKARGREEEFYDIYWI